ncbi:DnaA family protein [Natronospira proteinivora]|uniref:DnaA family protein n=1 Tax=Natronospira proteinivora TaxID=1807133 RepID=A0ABT1G4F6_9GAMM|nr:DnaA regulatory inactivator Hda [Natronospira proteinivora]MCP1726166.1 DnaA family protein [Natronospira proteinivora]
MSPAAMGTQLPLGVTLPLETRLRDFVPGSNGEALAAAEAVAEGRLSGCLYFAGSAASGKSHLLQGICRQAHGAGQMTAYLPLSDKALRDPELLQGWDGFDLVCIDDLDAMVGDFAWERALFRLYEGIKEQAGSLVVTAKDLPGNLGLDLPDLASRLASGPVYQLSPPDDQTLAVALTQRMERQGLVLPEESARWLLRRARRDMHTLMALADRLDRLSLSAQRRLTIPFLREALDPEL